MSFAAATRIEQIQTMIGSLTATPATPAQPAAATSFAQTLAAAQTPSGASGSGGGSTPFGAEIDAAAARYGIDPALLRGLVRQESGFDPRAHSSAGAMGLTQLMPATASSLGVTDPYDPAQSIDGGTHFLGDLLTRFKGDVRLALAAYDAGPSAVARYGGVPPYAETQQYVTWVLNRLSELKAGTTTGGSSS
jgi:soluble lytic murein transglycosylase-like protein